ncbi:MAG: DUF4139 domain-containing protein [candidate division KSB1 bacterium]|nr:DUF4139 domain-containing protein [candidate division KSB1 bacterium]MDZ7318272.1 DUF4139 domain-containing protein [candidate division KSB1 bacterium]MDZ7340136.1 DUF4139 domain-containing protein [candidate division KSB1 bacterium]
MEKYIIFMFVIFLATTLSLAQERELAVTVYNNDLAVIKDMRSLELAKGVSELKYQDVAAAIDPTSVHFRSLTAPDKVGILEQNYEYDLINADKIAQKYVDKNITVQLKDKKVFKGMLLSFDGASLILKTDSDTVKLISRENIANIDFPKLPEGLITRPTLVWKIQNDQPGKHKTEVSYLTSAMNWHAEYVAVSKDDDQRLELSAWVSIDNRSGATYPNAKLKLIAGEVHRVTPAVPMRAMGKAYALEAMDMSVPQFEEKPFFEYHLYTLSRPATISNNQIKQISLFPTASTNVKKIYSYEFQRAAEDVRVNLEFVNSKESGLGMPLPAGKVRVYKQDQADGSLEYVGEDMVEHTPKDEKVRLYLGNAFDIKPERAMTNKVSTGKNSYEETYQIKIRNHKDSPVEILVVEKFYGFWEIKRSSHTYKKKDAYTAEFTVAVPKDQEAVLEFTVAYRTR